MTTVAGIEIRQMRPDDEKSLPDFFAKAYGTEYVQYRYPDRWRWLNLENPFIPRGFGLPAWIALWNGEIVGYIGGMFVPCQIAGSKQVALWGIDLVVLEKCRGTGIGSRLMNAIMDADEMFLALIMEPLSRHIILRDGGREGPSAQLYVYTNCLKAIRLFRGVRDHLNFRLGKFAGRLAWGALVASGAPWLFARVCELRLKTLQKRKKAPRKPTTAKMRPVVGRFGQEADDLWEASSKLYDFAVVRGRDYLNWKYVDQPGVEYRSFYAYLGEVLSGLVVVRLGRGPEPRVGVIADILWADGHDGLIAELLQFAVDYLGHEHATAIHCASSVRAVIEALERLGFLNVSRYGLCIYYREGETNPLRENARLLLSKGDHDWDQYPWARHLSISEIRRIMRSG